MYYIILTQTIPNKITSHTNVLVNILIKRVFTSNTASSGCIFINTPFPPLNNVPKRGFSLWTITLHHTK